MNRFCGRHCYRDMIAEQMIAALLPSLQAFTTQWPAINLQVALLEEKVRVLEVARGEKDKTWKEPTLVN